MSMIDVASNDPWRLTQAEKVALEACALNSCSTKLAAKKIGKSPWTLSVQLRSAKAKMQTSSVSCAILMWDRWHRG